MLPDLHVGHHRSAAHCHLSSQVLQAASCARTLNPKSTMPDKRASSAHLQRGCGERLHAHKPLLAHQRLHNVAAALRARHARRVRLRADGQALCLRFGPQLSTYRSPKRIYFVCLTMALT